MLSDSPPVHTERVVEGRCRAALSQIYLSKQEKNDKQTDFLSARRARRNTGSHGRASSEAPMLHVSISSWGSSTTILTRERRLPISDTRPKQQEWRHQQQQQQRSHLDSPQARKGQRHRGQHGPNRHSVENWGGRRSCCSCYCTRPSEQPLFDLTAGRMRSN